MTSSHRGNIYLISTTRQEGIEIVSSKAPNLIISCFCYVAGMSYAPHEGLPPRTPGQEFASGGMGLTEMEKWSKEHQQMIRMPNPGLVRSNPGC